ncbi:4Fe-4S binding domain-containing protein [Fodinibius salinus]|uniref:4Fe-4S binding domain-containing protein n=1 Tax=Fodinibius salinus TaxID=860790 RepID=A0A5D3YJV4_9BACT|nr:4Fe-4S dicluster domain-containing protein [Fodinibius salinus]TYP92012.1 4Fe-4S binding domain-containing protein [Fodinibius salinus]
MSDQKLNKVINEIKDDTNPSSKGLYIIRYTGLALFVMGLLLFTYVMFMGPFELSKSSIEDSISNKQHRQAIAQQTTTMQQQSYTTVFSFIANLKPAIEEANETLDDGDRINDYKQGVYRLNIAKQASTGIIDSYSMLYFWLSIGLGCLGAIIFFLPKIWLRLPGIDNDHIYHNSAMSLGTIGWATGLYFIAFYVFIYWYPEYAVNWIKMVDPISMAIKGQPAGQWFLYGLLYTLAIVVMGVRMFIKYRHSKYHLVRTSSVMFFQTAFAFIIPELLVAFNKPYYDFKNIWPLDYDFFFDWQINTFVNSGSLGMFMLMWGIALTVVVVPVLTYFYGKRWYCSWVCGCGGLAETFGDPYRQLSDNSKSAWKLERWSVHSVLVLVTIMTIGVLYTYFTGSSSLLGIDTYNLRSWYGFLIGAAFAGVIGVGTYPILGNRPWCRFGCPLAAYLGLIQRFKSRFRITTNGGQCISCGNCSTYCEMGIDVRWYAQRGQNIVRSSCVGCGVCSSVCPRGVLKLENGPEEGRFNEPKAFTVHEDGVTVNGGIET